MDIKSLSPREVLLHPMDLLHQLFTTLLPGVLVLVLLMLKHSALIPAALGTTGMLGYNSRIALALLIAFVVGRIIQSGTVLVLRSAGWAGSLLKERPERRVPEESHGRTTPQQGGAEQDAQLASGVLTLQTVNAGDSSTKPPDAPAKPAK